MYPRPDGTIYLCGIGGSDYISRDELKTGAFRDSCDAKEDRVEAARLSFQDMSTEYKNQGKLDRIQACMRPCPPDALPYMGKIPGHRGAFINAGHNCWLVKHFSYTVGLFSVRKSDVNVSCLFLRVLLLAAGWLLCRNDDYRGIAWAPACGKAMAELVLEGCSKSVNLTPFDPCRFNPVIPHGGRGRKRRGANVGEQW